MMIMKAVDDIHGRGGKVEELVSLCGGLPDPVAADNPLRYKFSWSPRGETHWVQCFCIPVIYSSLLLRCNDCSLQLGEISAGWSGC